MSEQSKEPEVIVHESGRIFKLPRNEEATALYKATLSTPAEQEVYLEAKKRAGFEIIELFPGEEPYIAGDVLVLLGHDVWLR